jgi:uncharacterized protein YjbI with pentapeptide repeats
MTRPVSSFSNEAEMRLAEAVRSGRVCDFSDGRPVHLDEKEEWSSERTVRSAYLRELLLRETPGEDKPPVMLRAAALDGPLNLDDATASGLSLTECRVSTIHCDHTTFLGSVVFSRTTFEEAAVFTNTTFKQRVTFDASTFAGGADFHVVVFEDDAAFNSVTSLLPLDFSGSVFDQQAHFSGLRGADRVTYYHTVFTENVSFSRSTFSGTFDFSNAICLGKATFQRAVFEKQASFFEATFTTDADFEAVEFGGESRFDRSIARDWILRGSRFQTSPHGSLTGHTVDVSDAVMYASTRLSVDAKSFRAQGLEARDGLHVELNVNEASFEGADFFRRSIVAGLASSGDERIPHRDAPNNRAVDTRMKAEEQVYRLRRELASRTVTEPELLSLAGASVGGLRIAGLSLSQCAFAGAHGLDSLRIDPTCTFKWAPRPWGIPLYTRRRVLAEEVHWRSKYSKCSKHWRPLGGSTEMQLPGNIAGTYRDLRKSFEDAKDEPGAADFYYGEMEMRRLDRRREGVNTANQLQKHASRAERALLHLYWGLSGYGLRAWRSIASWLLLVIVTGLLFTQRAFAVDGSHANDLGMGDAAHLRTRGAITDLTPDWHTALIFALNESLPLLRSPHVASVWLTEAGVVVSFLLRLLGPLLLALSVLAMRSRMKR